MTMLETDNLMNVADVAELANIGPGTLRTYVRRGYGPPVTNVAGHMLFQRADVDAWLASRPGQGARTDLG
jgi:DNA-binding transcriptional MerR regulator